MNPRGHRPNVKGIWEFWWGGPHLQRSPAKRVHAWVGSCHTAASPEPQGVTIVHSAEGPADGDRPAQAPAKQGTEQTSPTEGDRETNRPEAKAAPRGVPTSSTGTTRVAVTDMALDVAERSFHSTGPTIKSLVNSKVMPTTRLHPQPSAESPYKG